MIFLKQKAFHRYPSPNLQITVPNSIIQFWEKLFYLLLKYLRDLVCHSLPGNMVLSVLQFNVCLALWEIENKCVICMTTLKKKMFCNDLPELRIRYPTQRSRNQYICRGRNVGPSHLFNKLVSRSFIDHTTHKKMYYIY